jgi:cytidine diphosphoramidate kinase
MVIWLIGMSAAGKTTLARRLYARLKPRAPNLVMLDGDDFREIFGHDLDHTVDGRRRNAERISRTCRFLDGQGIHVIAAVLSIFPEWQQWNRDNFNDYFEIFLDLPLETLKTRDPKELYAGAEAGRIADVVGIDIPFPRPARPDLVIDEALQDRGVDACVEAIVNRLPSLD